MGLHQRPPQRSSRNNPRFWALLPRRSASSRSRHFVYPWATYHLENQKGRLMPTTLRVICQIVMSTIFLFGIGSASAQEYPNKPIRLVVATTAGTQVDLLARTLGPELSKSFGQPIVVEN